MKDLADRIQRLFPQAKSLKHFEVRSDGSETYISHWDEEVLGSRPTEEQLANVDLTQPTAEQTRLQAIKQILTDDVPDAWRTSTNAQQRIAWALKHALIEIRQELKN